MTALTERLNELSARTKKTEQLVDAARTFNRTTLQARQAELLTSLDAGPRKMEDAAASARSTLGQWWEEMRTAVDDRFTGLRSHADEDRDNRDAHRTHRPAAPRRAG